jgi:hypothetical protein
LGYLITKLLEKEEYDKALYCLLTYKLLEPDHPKLESWRARIGSWITEPDLPTYKAPAPADLVLLDANALFRSGYDGVSDSTGFLKSSYVGAYFVKCLRCSYGCFESQAFAF